MTGMGMGTLGPGTQLRDSIQIPDNALDLLTPRPDRIEPWVNPYYGGFLGVVTGFVCACSGKLYRRRPALSGIQTSIAAAVGTGVLFHFLSLRRAEHLAEKDAVLRHYVELHPEDFVFPPKVKYADVLEPWVPIR